MLLGRVVLLVVTILLLDPGVLYSEIGANDLDDVQTSRTIPWMTVPPMVQQSFFRYTGAASLSRVQELTVNGQRVYRGVFWQGGQPFNLTIASDGSLINTDDEISWDEVPLAVQLSVRSLNNPGTVESVIRQQRAGETFYSVILSTAGQQSTFRFMPDGSLSGMRSEFPVSITTQKVRWDDVPFPVQGTIQAQGGTAETADVSVMFNEWGNPVYRAIFQQGDQRRELQIVSSGMVVGGATVITGNAAALRPGSLTLDQLPAPTQATVLAMVNGQPVETIREQVIDDTPCYRVTFYSDGRRIDVTVAADGAVVPVAP